MCPVTQEEALGRTDGALQSITAAPPSTHAFSHAVSMYQELTAYLKCRRTLCMDLSIKSWPARQDNHGLWVTAERQEHGQLGRGVLSLTHTVNRKDVSKGKRM